MAGTTVGAEPMTARLGWPTASRCVHQHKASMCSRRSPGTCARLVPRARAIDEGRRRGAPAHGEASPWRRGWGGRAGEGSRARARERACGFKNAPALAPPGETHHRGRRHSSPRRNAGELSSVEGNEREMGVVFRWANACLGARRVHTWASSRVCAFVSAPVPRPRRRAKTVAALRLARKDSGVDCEREARAAL
jgi:hypothetical protein